MPLFSDFRYEHLAFYKLFFKLLTTNGLLMAYIICVADLPYIC